MCGVDGQGDTVGQAERYRSALIRFACESQPSLCQAESPGDGQSERLTHQTQHFGSIHMSVEARIGESAPVSQIVSLHRTDVISACLPQFQSIDAEILTFPSR
jgi:hypothetical protein